MTSANTELMLRNFESNVRSYGPEVAFRDCVQLFGEAEALRIRHAYERKVGIIADKPGSPTLHRRTFADWYSGPSDSDRFWPALKSFLRDKKHWPAETIEALDDESTNVMKRLAPVFGPVDVKGLVVGYVQSGKTANYTALIAKAADVGYRLIIVLAGIHNSLRRQTQVRLQAELIDADDRVKPMWHTLTLPQEDFQARNTNTDAFLSRDSHQRILLVVKKNAQVLKRLNKWLAAAQPRLLEACPALIIDDEADQAGLNTGKAGEENRSAINRLILKLKQTLPKSAYVGYTATPFANVLVDPSGDDLYPADFIVALRKPPTYFGAELFFGREPLENDEEEPPAPPDMFRLVEQTDVPLVRPSDRQAGARFDAVVPPSLQQALEYFLLATAARWARGQRFKHSSMLVHTALQTSVHRQLQSAVESELARLRSRDGLASAAVRQRLEALWESERSRVPRAGLDPVAFSAVLERLKDVLDHAHVVVDNSLSESRLVYKDESMLVEGDKVVHIAIGGNTLSRGLTLEGLVVSYFVRSASAYDTLLQMGRWFGYRFGYEDFPRIWMTEELRDAFRSLATVEEEIRADIARYEDERRTPRDFAVRIRRHPTLAVTSRLKMRHAVTVEIDYTGFTRQTTVFKHLDEAWLRRNWEAGRWLVESISSTPSGWKRESAHHYKSGVPAEDVLRFLGQYESHEIHTDLHRDLLTKYIKKRNSKGELERWTVAIVSLNEVGSARIGPIEVYPVNRSKLSGDTSADLGTITTQSYFGFGLPDDQPATATSSTKRSQPRRPAGAEPLLLLIPIDKDSRPLREPAQPGRQRHPLGAGHHVLGMALAFPDSNTGRFGENYIQVQLPERQDYIDVDEVDEAVVAEDDG